MERSQTISALSGTFDILVIGGGATGLGIAVDAASRGYRIALVEGGDFAQATSSRATKLVHGGVRYLASGQIHLVTEALHERALMLKNAPHLVKIQPFITPTYTWLELPYYAVGLKLYDVISGKASLGPTQVLSSKETADRLPGLSTTNLKGSILYHDGQFDDARFALALALTAQEEGAVVANYVRAVQLTKLDGKITGAIVHDVETGQEITVRAQVVINAAGIFLDELRGEDQPGLPKLLSTSRGTHIVVDARALGSENAIMVPKTPDGRVIFAIPWLGKVIIGTTDLPSATVDTEPGHQESEIDYLLETINPYLSEKLTREDVLSVFSGLRPLVTGASGATSKLSREHFIDKSPSGLITVAGGKWTTYRRMAEDALSFAIKAGMLPNAPCKTRDLRLHGAVLMQDTPEHLRAYGADAPQVMALEREPGMDEKLDAALPFTVAQVVFAVRYEMALTVEDVLSRRTRALLLDAEAVRRAAPKVARIMAAELGKSGQWAQEQAASFDVLVCRYYLLGASVPETVTA